MPSPQHKNKIWAVVSYEGASEKVDGLSSVEHQKYTTLPPSSSSSPPHEFSFDVYPFPTIDSSPADDIFFNGHLLPLNVIPRPPVCKTNSRISFKDLNHPSCREKSKEHTKHNSFTCRTDRVVPNDEKKSNPFSMFELPKWRELSESKESRKDTKRGNKMSRIFTRLIKALFIYRKGEKEKREVGSQTCSLHGNSNWKWMEWRGKRSRGESMKTSPMSNKLPSTPSSIASLSSRTLEKRQKDIQDAIEYCKSSMAGKEDMKSYMQT